MSYPNAAEWQKFAVDAVLNGRKAEIDAWLKAAKPGAKGEFKLDLAPYGVTSLGGWMKAGDPSTYTTDVTQALVRLIKTDNGGYRLFSAYPIIP